MYLRNMNIQATSILSQLYIPVKKMSSGVARRSGLQNIGRAKTHSQNSFKTQISTYPYREIKKNSWMNHIEREIKKNP
jgi:hypothetical protein